MLLSVARKGDSDKMSLMVASVVGSVVRLVVLSSAVPLYQVMFTVTLISTSVMRVTEHVKLRVEPASGVSSGELTDTFGGGTVVEE